MLNPIYWEYARCNYLGVAQDLKYITDSMKLLNKSKYQPVLNQGANSSIFTQNTPPQELSFDNVSPINPATKAIAQTNERVKNKDYTGAFLIASQAALDLPNIIDDTSDAIYFADKWLKSKTMNDKSYLYLYRKAYDWKTAQHPFSYFRGTLLKDFVNPNSPKCVSQKLANWVKIYDKALIDTKYGKFIKKKTNTEVVQVRTKIKSLKSTPQRPINIKAYKFITNSKIANITARSMTRVPVIGLAFSGAIEASQVVHEIKQGEKTIKAVEKGIIRFTTSTITTAVLGAIGAMALGPLGSLAGIAVAGFINNAVAKAIS